MLILALLNLTTGGELGRAWSTRACCASRASFRIKEDNSCLELPNCRPQNAMTTRRFSAILGSTIFNVFLTPRMFRTNKENKTYRIVHWPLAWLSLISAALLGYLLLFFVVDSATLSTRC